MPIVKDYPTENFVQVHNDTVRDQNLTFEARGVLVYLLSRSASWNPCISDISEQGKLGLNKTKRILAELEAAGYIKKNQARSEGNRFGSVSRTVYGRVYSGPMALEQHKSISGDFRAAEFGATESRATESVVAEKSPTKERVLKKDITKEIKEGGEAKKRFTPPTRQEVEDYMLTKGASFEQAASWSEDFVDFYACKGWMVGKNKMQSWPMAASRWTKKNLEECKKLPAAHKQTIEDQVNDTNW